MYEYQYSPNVEQTKKMLPRNVEKKSFNIFQIIRATLIQSFEPLEKTNPWH